MTRDRVQGEEKLPVVKRINPGISWEILMHASSWDLTESIQGLRKLAHVITRLLSIIFEWLKESWSKYSLEAISGHVKEKRTENSQHGFTKGKLCFTNLSSVTKWLHLWMRGEQWVPDLSKSLAVLHSILLTKLGFYFLDGWTTTWVKTHLYHQPLKDCG